MKVLHPQNIITTSGVFKASLVLKNSLDLRSLQNTAIHQGVLLKPSNTEKKGFIFQSQIKYIEVGWRKYSTMGFLHKETLIWAKLSMLPWWISSTSQSWLLKLVCTLIAALNKPSPWVRYRFLLMLCMDTHTHIFTHHYIHMHTETELHYLLL